MKLRLGKEKLIFQIKNRMTSRYFYNYSRQNLDQINKEINELKETLNLK